MRLSIRWIFDHISQKIDWQSFNIYDLVKLLNKTTSEIEHVEHFKFDLDKFTIAKVTEILDSGITVHSDELNLTLLLPYRKDALIDSCYLIKRHNQGILDFNWAYANDLGSEKSYLIPAIQNHILWKDSFETQDYILVIDNKAISHRPDLWGHRGFAREVAALTGYDIKPLEKLIADKPIEHCSQNKSQNGPFCMEIKSSHNDTFSCKRFAGLYIPEITNQPSDIAIASRLIKVDAKPIDFIVDATNYVMFDLGQPIHVYDASKIHSKKIVIQQGYGDNLKLLDDTEVVLDAKDCVVYDGDQLGASKPIALAGIMGGANTAVSMETKSIFVESANFDATAIRHSSMRLRKRTEASARFEKSLDPNQNVAGILRFLSILDQKFICYLAHESITSLGASAKERVIEFPVDLVKKLLSISVEPKVVEKILTKIDFGVTFDNSVYSVTVPTFRGTKDVTIPADIVEEIARFIGYEVIDVALPTRVMSAFDFKSVQNIRDIKKHLAYGLQINETQSYAFFDEEFLKALSYDPGKTVEVLDPQSENWRRLVTSLIPNLLKVVDINAHKQEKFRYFELNRIWRELARFNLVDTNGATTSNVGGNLNAVEAFELAGIIGDHKGNIDFYECKNLINSIFELLHINAKWLKPELKDLGSKRLDPWYYGYETAELTFDGQVIGLAGMADSRFLNKIMPEGRAFIFELNADFLINSRPEFKKFAPLEKYPEVHFDISIFVPSFISVHDIEKLIKETKISEEDTKITHVKLLDFFEKEEWGNKKSLTFRIALNNQNKTLIKSEVDQIYERIVTGVKKIGGEVR